MTTKEKADATCKILNLAKMNPLANLAWNLHNSGYTSNDINHLMNRKEQLNRLPDPFKVAIVNALSDIERSGKVLTKINLPVDSL